MIKKIVIADDEKSTRDILKEWLSCKNYKVFTAENGKEAFETIKKEKPHLIIADTQLPEIDGYKLCKMVREDKELYSLRFIFLGARNLKEDEIKGLSLGADDYIPKPFDLEKLTARIEARMRWIDERKETLKEGSLEGSLAGKNLLDILQILEMGKKEGEIEVYGEKTKGTILISQGMIVDATLDDKKGKNALFLMLNWEKGKFKFTPKTIQTERKKLNIPIAQAILEWGKLRDEFSNKESQDEHIAFLKYIFKKAKKIKT